MKLTIDHHEIEAVTGQTLLELVRNLGLDTKKLSERPLAANASAFSSWCVKRRTSVW